eukprot:361360-Chlamydomonas_euryale.AAC.4
MQCAGGQEGEGWMAVGQRSKLGSKVLPMGHGWKALSPGHGWKVLSLGHGWKAYFVARRGGRVAAAMSWLGQCMRVAPSTPPTHPRRACCADDALAECQPHRPIRDVRAAQMMRWLSVNPTDPSETCVLRR